MLGGDECLLKFDDGWWFGGELMREARGEFTPPPGFVLLAWYSQATRVYKKLGIRCEVDEVILWQTWRIVPVESTRRGR